MFHNLRSIPKMSRGRNAFSFRTKQPVRMETTLRGAMLSYAYRLVDVRDLDGDRLLESPIVDDNIIGILTRLKDARGAIY